MRASHSSEFLNCRNNIAQVFEHIKNELHENLYLSVSTQRSCKEAFLVNPKERSFSDDQVVGTNVRVFDGVTMHEWASPELDLDVLLKNLNPWLLDMRQLQPQQKVYVSPPWSQRIEGVDEPDLLDQIPNSPRPDEWVEFGMNIDVPWPKSTDEKMQFIETKYKAFNSAALNLADGHPARVLDFSMGRFELTLEEHAFIDDAVRMSQVLPRVLAVIVGIKGAERAYYISGGLGGMETIHLEEEQFSEIFTDLKNLVNAKPLAPGRYQLLMHPSVSGVFAHEAFGHSQEGDTWARNRSKAKDLYESQESVGNEHATILNNPAIYKNAWENSAAWGSYYFDEEGWLASRQVLVERGRLKQPMTDFVSAYHLGVPRSANGKREKWSHSIYTRQTNTYFSAGTKSFKELIGQVKSDTSPDIPTVEWKTPWEWAFKWESVM
ncbi:MAG: metallopeptidase TldD-related protein [Bdellovibrionales bacterium]